MTDTTESIEGTYRDLVWEAETREYDAEEDAWYLEQYGDLLVRVSDDDGTLYYEYHDSDETHLHDLENRAREIINRYVDRDSIGKCPKCGMLYNTERGPRANEYEFSWFDRHLNGMTMPPYRSMESEGASKTCVWTTGRLFETLHIKMHHTEENPLFTDEELAENSSVVMCRGYVRAFDEKEPRSYEEIKEVYADLQRKTVRGKVEREARQALIDSLGWVLKRRDQPSHDIHFSR